MNRNDYSVLMSVYVKEKAEFLRAAMDSMWNQTIPTNDFVLVCDGALNAELDAVIAEMEKEHSGVLRVVRFGENGGLGNALKAGVKHCRNELIARMDSDDISRPYRCERQLEVFQKDESISICSGIVEEFSASTDTIKGKRILPERHGEIAVFARKRNPFNHPCVMFRKSAVEAAGGYQEFYLLEDYYLWIRMLQKGFIGYNLREPLLWMRAGSELYRRRAGWKYAKSQTALFKYMKDTGFISFDQYIKSAAIRGALSMMPNWSREFVVQSALRKR